MKNQKFHKKDVRPKTKDLEDGIYRSGKNKVNKEKYKHKNHWLEEDDDTEMPKYKDEEE